MFDGLKRSVAASAIMTVLRSLATNKDTQTSITGIIAGLVVAIPHLDMKAVLMGDPAQVGHLAAGLLVGLIGLWATKHKRDTHTTLAGALAGTLYGMTGQIGDVVTGVVIAILGYYTNKPVGISAADSAKQ